MIFRTLGILGIQIIFGRHWRHR